MSLIARYFESRAIPTLIMGSALDILQQGRAPRVQFVDYPLGFQAGRPFDPKNQLSVLRASLAGFETMEGPSLERLDFQWPEGWERVARAKDGPGNVDLRSPRDTIARYQKAADTIHL